MQIPGYRIIRKINQGGMSTVYLAVQLSVGREVALKVMSPVLNADPVFSERFQREANIVGQLSHPNIVSIYDIGRYKNLNYIAMDYLPGGTVHEKMAEGMTTADIMRITKEVAKALNVAHNKGYVHRDIKPENILFREDGTTVLTDFGVAKAISTSAKVTNAGTVVGTPHYMSPEQSRGKPLDGRSDIYSLGVVFFEMLTGRVPFQADDSVAIAIKHLTEPVPTLPGQYAIYQSLINKLLAKNAADRFQTGADLVAAIEVVEETLAGNPQNRTLYTDPDSMNVMALFKALVLTSMAALRAKGAQLAERWFAWRWTPRRGFYRHPTVKVTSIRTDVDSDEEERETIISSRVQKAAHYREASAGKLTILTRAIAIAFVIITIWSSISVGLVRFEVPTDNFLPSPLNNALLFTAATIEDTTQRFMGDEPSSSPQPTPSVTIASTQAQSDDSDKAAEEPNATPVEEAPQPEPVPESPTEPPPPPTYGLTVETTPADARVRILNIVEKYHDGIDLESGRYLIEVSDQHFKTRKEWVRLRNDDLTVRYQLTPKYKAGDTLSDQLADKTPGPEMRVIPTGTFVMGNQGDAHVSPPHEVTIDYHLAVSRYEVTFAAYRKFAEATERPLPDDNGWGQASRPVINVSWRDAKAYAQWLSEQTGRNYRLPSEAEWEYFARAGTQTDYWWGDQKPEGKANCKRGCDSDYAGFFSSETAPVGTYAANPFGLHDTAGNVAEWTLDCYQDHYIGAPDDGSPLQQNNCQKRSVRGGSAKDSSRELTSYAREGAAPGTRSERIGFRVVVELGEW